MEETLLQCSCYQFRHDTMVTIIDNLYKINIIILN